jgi:hypothetical protein
VRREYRGCNESAFREYLGTVKTVPYGMYARQDTCRGGYDPPGDTGAPPNLHTDIPEPVRLRGTAGGRARAR